MASIRKAMLKCAGESMGCAIFARRWAIPAPLDSAISYVAAPPSLVWPESYREFENGNNVGFDFSSFSFGYSSMELMAVPKRKVTPHRKGLRNGPKALKPVPVIIRCKSCGRVKLPHFFCCSGERGNTGERSG